MAESFTIGDPPISVSIRRNAAARRVVLSLGRSGRKPVVTAPPAVSMARVQAFAREHEGWLRGELARAQALVSVGDGARLTFRGNNVTVTLRPSGPTTVEGDRFFVSAPPSTAPAKVAAFLREAARAACAASAEIYAAKVGRATGRMTMRDPRGRWGSCNQRGDLMFSWRLILAPADVLDYVVAHEVAHLVEMNHSPRFWRVVRDIFGDYQPPRAWLRSHGRRLMLYDFSAGGKAAEQ